MPIQLDLTDEQLLFHETTARFIAAELPRAKARERHGEDEAFDRDWLAKAAALGWFSPLVAEEHGGGSVSSRPMSDAALVAEVQGRQVQPGPFVPMNVALAAMAARGSDELREEVVAPGIGGDLVVTWAFADRAGCWDAGAGVTLVEQGDGYAVSGRRAFVQDGAQADWLLVTATLHGGPVQVVVPARASGVEQVPLTALDLARRFSDVTLDAVHVPGGALVDGDAGDLDRQLQQAAALAAVETVGAMDELFTMTVAYAKDRIAFGRPIGSFQALKHLMADVALGLETAKAAASAAIDALDEERPDAAEVVSMAAAFVGEQGNETAQQCLQIHGGIGYTWEHDLHLLLRRIQTNSVLYGTPSWHRERVCRFHELGEVPAP